MQYKRKYNRRRLTVKSPEPIAEGEVVGLDVRVLGIVQTLQVKAPCDGKFAIVFIPRYVKRVRR